MTWTPCSGRNSVAGLSWLPRLLEKARHCEASGSGKLVDGYCYGDNDFIDKQMLGSYARRTFRSPHSCESIRTMPPLPAFSSNGAGALPPRWRVDKAFRRKNFNFALLERAKDG
jgi:hypothetical protein